jgi:hypothetical protein
MSDSIDGSPNLVGQQGMSERSHATTNAGGEGSVIAEFVDAARSAAESLLEEQKQQIADRIKGVAEALECAARSLEGSQNHLIARYVQQAEHQVKSLSRELHERQWSELVADTYDVARRQPTLFVLGAVATGFLVGRFLWTARNMQNREAGGMHGSSRRETTREVTAAISSAPGAGGGTGEAAGHAAGSSGTMESR